MFDVGVLDLHRSHHWFQQGRKDRFTNPAEREACKRDAELRGTQRAIEIRENRLRDSSPAAALLNQRTQLCVANFDQGKFRRDKESVQENEQSDGHEPPKKANHLVHRMSHTSPKMAFRM